MAEVNDEQVWRYQAPGEPPKPVPVPTGVDPSDSAERGRWRGLAACSESGQCGMWWVDIDESTLESAIPLPCPCCSARSAWPQLCWREAIVDCGLCGTTTTLGVIDPQESWPGRADCPDCDAPLLVPQHGLAHVH